MKPSRSQLWALLSVWLASVLTGCSTYSSVKSKRPVYQPITQVGRSLANVSLQGNRKPLVSLGEYMDALKQASTELQKNPADEQVRGDYNYAVSRIIGLLGDAKLDSWAKPIVVSGPSGTHYSLSNRPDPRPQWNPALYTFTPADQFDINGKYVHDHLVKKGVGAPLVAVGRNKMENARENFALERTYYGVTGVAHMDASNHCVISFEDPLATENVTLHGRQFPLSADFTVPLAVMLSQENPKKLELARLLKPGKYAATARIAKLQPYDPNRQVILCVHGLMDSPATWTPLINTLRSDPEIRKRYQFWFYSYPSGYPYQHSAAILRQQLDAVQLRFPLKKKMVIIGHSMGGMISRLMVTDSTDKVWNHYFDKSPEELKVSPESKKLITDALIFKHRSEIGRAIFIAAPQRGATMAAGWVGRLGSKLVKSPFTLLQAGSEMVGLIKAGATDEAVPHIPNSVDTLSPNNPFVKIINTIPIAKHIPYHTICGDRGKGGNPDKTKPVRGDGFVPYWSSHLEGAKSELIVPSGHSAHQHPLAIKEVRRILLLP